MNFQEIEQTEPMQQDEWLDFCWWVENVLFPERGIYKFMSEELKNDN